MSQESASTPAGRRPHAPSNLGAAKLFAVYGMAAAALLIAAVWIAGMGSGPATAQTQSSGTPICEVPVDVSVVFDHSGSMSQASKLSNAQSAATGFVDTISGGDGNLSPHEMALTGFFNGSATTDVALTTNANQLKNAINGYQALGTTDIGRGVQLGQVQLVGQSDPDFLVLLSDGSANRPMDVDGGGSEDQFYIDVNDNGYLDFLDALAAEYPAPEADGVPDFRVLNGRWLVDTPPELLEALDVNGDNFVDQFDDFNFGPGYNFSIIDGALYLDANGDGNFAPNGLEPPNMTLGHDDELAVLRTGRVWGNNVDFSGDGPDVYAQYWATQAKSAGTVVYVIGYDLGASQDGDLLEAMASSPAHYFAGGRWPPPHPTTSPGGRATSGRCSSR